MRWPWRYHGTARDREGKELAKRQLEIASVIHEESVVSAHEHRFLLYENHFAQKATKAFGGK